MSDERLTFEQQEIISELGIRQHESQLHLMISLPKKIKQEREKWLKTISQVAENAQIKKEKRLAEERNQR